MLCFEDSLFLGRSSHLKCLNSGPIKMLYNFKFLSIFITSMLNSEKSAILIPTREEVLTNYHSRILSPAICPMITWRFALFRSALVTSGGRSLSCSVRLKPTMVGTMWLLLSYKIVARSKNSTRRTDCANKGRKRISISWGNSYTHDCWRTHWQRTSWIFKFMLGLRHLIVV